MEKLRKAQGIMELDSIYDMLSLKGKVALITGAAGGIGRSTAAALAELGAKVMLMDIPQTEKDLKTFTDQIQERYGAQAQYVLGDVTDPQSILDFVNKTAKAFGTIDILHNNAGIGGRGDDAGITLDTWNKMVAVNMTGPLLVAQAVVRVMKEHNHGGSIVTTASMSGVVVNTGPGYASTKAGVRHLTDSLAMQYAKDGIRFNSVCYGFILSGMHENMGLPDAEAIESMYKRFEETTPMGIMGNLSDAVGCVVYLASDLSRFTTGTSIICDGGYCTR